jgi:hypothetical protein
MTTVRIPTRAELRDRLTGVNRLLFAHKWERAAIVFAFTEVGEPGAGRWRKPEPPKMHIREFAAQGFAGLTTNKAVSRYRDAWVSAVSNGWTTLAEPGKTVELPDQEFPVWPYGSSFDEVTATVTQLDDANVTPLDDYRTYSPRIYTPRPAEARLLSGVTAAAKALSTLGDLELSDEVRHELVDRLTELQTATRDALRALRGLRQV